MQSSQSSVKCVYLFNVRNDRDYEDYVTKSLRVKEGELENF